MAQDGFYTMKGYTLLEHGLLTSSMEDYLEMICRLSEQSSLVRISDLAQALHVKPPSASKMAGNLRAQELIEFPKYGCITLTEMGKRMGSYLIRRHELVNSLLCRINGTENELEEVEKIEHFLSPRTVKNIEGFLRDFGNINGE